MPRYLIPIGGNEKKSNCPEIFSEMVALAGGEKAKIVVVPTASVEPNERALNYHEVFSDFNVPNIKTVHIGQRQDAGLPELLKIINEATLFMFTGGDQLRLSSLIGGTPLHETLLERYQAGKCVIAGTSAGAAVMPEVMIYQNNQFRRYRKGGIEMTKGLGLVDDVIFDTHFIQRSRISRLAHTVATNPALLGMGIEENTGLLVEDETFAKVIGTGTVVILDGRNVEINHIGFADNGKPFAHTNINYSVLTPGMVYDLKQRKVVDAGPLAPPESLLPKTKVVALK